MGNLVIASFALLRDKQFQLRGAHVPVRELSGVNDDMVLVDPQLPTEEEWSAASDRAAELFGIAAGQQRTAANVGALARELAAAAKQRRGPCRDLVAALDKHAATLGLEPGSARLATARLGLSVVEGLSSARDEVALVAGLAGMQVPAEPQPLARSMSTAGDVAAALHRHDWSTLDAVALAAVAGDASAEQPLAALRTAARAEELHSPLQPALASAQQAATQWLLERRSTGPGPTPPGPTPPGPTPPAPTPPGPGPQPGPTTKPPVTDPDEVVLDIDAAELDDRMLTLAEEIGRSLAANPGKKVRITWSLQ
jgi:hypothetical protein